MLPDDRPAILWLPSSVQIVGEGPLRVMTSHGEVVAVIGGRTLH
jgi:hypothetical protein